MEAILNVSIENLIIRRSYNLNMSVTRTQSLKTNGVISL